MTCSSFDRSSLYRKLDKFYMRETNINGHYLVTVLQIFNNSADLSSSSISKFCLISDANMLAQNI